MTILRLLPVLLLAACATRSVIEESRAFAARNDYPRAYQVLDRAVAAYEQDGDEAPEELLAAYRTARIDHLFHRAEASIFEEREDSALVDTAELAELAPDYPGLGALRSRALQKKAHRICLRAQESLMRKDYAAAMVGFLEADQVVPGYPAAKQGVADVRAATAAMTQRAQEQFLEAVRKVPEFRYVEVQWHAANVLHNEPERAEAQDLQQKARRENALKAMARGRAAESKGRYGAALVEYRAARKIDGQVPDAEKAIAAMEQEVKAQTLVDAAQIDLRAGRTDVARQQLDEAFALSVLMRNDIGLLRTEVRKAEGMARYRVARDLEVLGRKLEALAAFRELIAAYPEGLSEEKARAVALQVDVEGWARHWSAADGAEAQGDLDKAVEEGMQAQRYYAHPEGKARLDKLRAAAAAKKAAAGGNAGGSQP